MIYEAVIGLEVHAEMGTRSKMFCACPVVDTTQAAANIAVSPVCSGMPGVLPVVNRRAVEYALRVALALNCEISGYSIFARKNYFYPDLPKGYQISQYEYPLAREGHLAVNISGAAREIRIRRVHLEEDTGKLTHIKSTHPGSDGTTHSLVNLNRAGIPLLEIVTEPDLRSAKEVRAFAISLRSIMQYLEVNSGDMEKGVMRIEPNISVRETGSVDFGTRTEIKNLNSFRALENSIKFELQRQSQILDNGGTVKQETRGWDEVRGETFSQRRKEEEDDYRYFPEPDLPALVVDPEWLEEIRSELPELPHDRIQRFQLEYGLSAYDAEVLTSQRTTADFFEAAIKASPEVKPKIVSNWITGDLFSLLNKDNLEIDAVPISPDSFGQLLNLIQDGEINQKTAKQVLLEMFETGEAAADIVDSHELRQISEVSTISTYVEEVIAENPEQVEKYIRGKESLAQWFYGQVMRAAQGKANPQIVQEELDRQLKKLK